MTDTTAPEVPTIEDAPPCAECKSTEHTTKGHVEGGSPIANGHVEGGTAPIAFGHVEGGTAPIANGHVEGGSIPVTTNGHVEGGTPPKD
jgi:hypothetical protein